MNRSNISNIVRILSQDETLTSSKEPTTQLIKALLIDFDFQKAIECLCECQKVFQTDFFLQSKNVERQFFEASRVLFINTYSRINTEGDLNAIDAIFKKFGCDDSIPVSQIVTNVQKSNSFNYSPTLIHAQTRYRAQSIVCRSNAILDNINKVN
uniref:Eukaryotic translation initiation factor 3 subunit E n=1 Tax=Lygus hesperus TaxID=30085 RepID=A0A0A9W1X0_LYGHE